MRIFKKISLCILILLCFITFSGFVSEKDGKTYVFDDAGVIDDDDEQALTQKCQSASKSCEVTIAIVTTYDAKGLSSREYAESMIRKYDLGYEKDKFDKSVVLFLLDLDNGETYIATSGLGILFVEDYDIEQILDQVYMYINTDYYSACSAFIDKTVDVIHNNKRDYGSEYIEEWGNYNGSYEKFHDEYVDQNEHNVFFRLKDPVMCLIIAVIIGGVSVAVMAMGNKPNMTANGSTYMDKQNFKMHLKTDQYIRTTTKKIKINTDSGGNSGSSSPSRSSGGGSSHRGSGGHSYGGGGSKPKANTGSGGNSRSSSPSRSSGGSSSHRGGGGHKYGGGGRKL